MDDPGVRSVQHMRARVTDRVDDAGSVVCLCMRCVRRRKCSLMDSCTSVGMSGDVWLIFTAASRKPIEPTGSFTFSVAMVTDGCRGLGSSRSGGCGGGRSGPREEPQRRVLAGCRDARRNFQETKARRPSRVRPQTTNTASRRPKVASGDAPQGPGTDHTIWRNRWRERTERERRAVRTCFYKWWRRSGQPPHAKQKSVLSSKIPVDPAGSQQVSTQTIKL